MPETELSPLALALGRIPCGLYVVTSLQDGQPLGFVGSFAMQMGFDPPAICIGVGKERAPLSAIRASGRFALSILDDQSRGLMASFFKKYPEGGSPFDELALLDTPGGLPVLEKALAWLDCRVSGEFETGDHVVVFGEVTGGELMRQGDSSVHLRKDGFSY